jgi:eukaryotic-like serine/threonine-protein kinase
MTACYDDGFPPRGPHLFMVLASGDRIGPFEIVAHLGAGAMGEVYRARDTRLGREVAIKVLLPSLSSDADAVARFEIEARAVAALSHPNIVALHDVGQHGRTTYVVTELLQGETLRDRLRAGPLPLRKAIDYARQIAEALGAAHERGIVHRDLKPENVFVSADGRIKVLDFGLAQMAVAPAMGDAVTLAQPAAGSSGGLFGSVGYMAPEQARGGAVDHRADIFALGCLLYELVTGRRAFAGGTPADTLAAILNADPAPIGGPAGGQIDRLVRRCLEKSPGERFQSARDLAFALDAVAVEARPEAGSEMSVRRTGMVAVAISLAVLAIAGVAALMLWRRADAGAAGSTQVARFGIPSATVTWADAASVSPDGRWVVYTGGSATTQQAERASPGTAPGGRPTNVSPVSGRFWLRPLDSLDSIRLSETEAAYPLFFWSPDSRTLGYRAGNAIAVRELPNGTARMLAEFSAAPQGVSWGSNGNLLIAAADGIYLVAAAGGTPRLVMKTDREREIWRGSPAFLPGGDRFLYTARTNGGGEQALETRLASIDGRDLGAIARGIIGALYADGALLFGSGGALYAQTFDAGAGRLSGDRVQLAPSVVQDWRTGRLAAAASNTGVLVFHVAPRADAQFALVTRLGRHVRNIAAPDSYSNFSLSPDEQRLVVSRADPQTQQVSLWMIDVARGVTSLISDTDDRLDIDDPTWAPDGQSVAYRHGPRLVLRPANGGDEKVLLDVEAYPDSFSRDGRWLVYGQPHGNAFEQWALDLGTPGAKPVALVTNVTLADEGRVSPNGKWIAYHSNETGGAQVNVIPFPRTGGRWQISQNGGVQPRWSADGNELFYLHPDGRLMAVRMPGSDPRQAGAPEPLFQTGLMPSDAIDQYAPTRDGFIIRAPVSAGADALAVQVVLNWKTLLPAR